MKNYWSGIWREAFARVRAGFGWNMPTMVLTAAPVLTSLGLRLWLAGWDEMWADLSDTAVYAILPAIIVGIGAIVWNVLKIPAERDAELQGRLKPFDYDSVLAESLYGKHVEGLAILARVMNRGKYDNSLEADYERWNNDVVSLMSGRLPPNEVQGFRTVSPNDFSWGAAGVERRVGKLRLIYLRYIKNAPLETTNQPALQHLQSTTDDPLPPPPSQA